MVSLRSTLPLLLVVALLVFEEKVSSPSCQVVEDRGSSPQEGPKGGSSDDFKVMMVANLLLMGSEAGYTNIYFRDSYMSKFFRKSFERLKPDMLVVLGDISAKGSELTSSKWLSVLQQLQRILGPFLGLPLHVVLGDRDVGECNKLNAKSVNQIASSLPGLDSAGCGSFEVSNISFVSLNAVALLCGNNDLRFSVERVIERENLDLSRHDKKIKVVKSKATDRKNDIGDFHWRDNAVESGTGPVLLLHFPLHRSIDHCRGHKTLSESIGSHLHESSSPYLHRGYIGDGPHEVVQSMPSNATEYIFQALRPRIVFSAHTHKFCYHTHRDGTREVTVPAMTWNVKDDPGFVIATFRQNDAVIVSQCSLARESHVLMAYASVLVEEISKVSPIFKSQNYLKVKRGLEIMVEFGMWDQFSV
ncbi:hypothetical protein H6P81_011552 [Aristolochia fimbriata]|uniref:Calcineurin-like phosphoesterase domain-containing protein n=1 Tax=Aristolochia fimbriata TaxID=158543 RepID=A0AAV7EVE0_ARIFI|nr:hypothetical protein H6P81_011552 [Aristolochia fimbriata]